MTVLSGQSIRERQIFTPFSERTKHLGLTYGLGPAGYDVRIAEDIELPPGAFSLGSTVEHFTIPGDLVGRVHDKSSLARVGLDVKNTIIEPGWYGFLTLELTNNKPVYEVNLTRLFTILQEAGSRERFDILDGLSRSRNEYTEANTIRLVKGQAIAQIIFELTDKPVEKPYDGKYQNQLSGPQQAIFEVTEPNIYDASK